MQYLLSTGHMVFYNLNHAATLARLAYFKNPSVSNLAPSMLPKISIIVPIYEELRGLIDRRKIVEARGFDEESIVEDMATSMLKWHLHGLKVGLIDEVLAYGLVPDTIESFKKQQYRWSLGAFKLFPKLLKNMRALTFFSVLIIYLTLLGIL